MYWPARSRPISWHLFGADVIKIEPPDEPDQTRNIGADKGLNQINMGTFYLAQSSNKRSITLNIKTEQGRAILRKLVVQADVMVENYRPGALKALGLGADDMMALNPRLIYASMSAFGQDGPRGSADRLRHEHPGKFRHHGDDRHRDSHSAHARTLSGRLCERRHWRPLRWPARCFSASAPAKGNASTSPWSTSR